MPLTFSVKGVVYLEIPGVGAAIGIWDNVFFKIRVLVDGQVSRKDFFSESSHRIERHLDVVIEILEIQSSVSFEFYLDKELINLGELNSCLRVHMPPILSQIPPFNGGVLLLVWTVVVGSGGVDVTF